MLLNVPDIISPELLKILDEMGHGDEIVLTDRNFPGMSNAQRIVNYRGVGVRPILRAVLELIPVDIYVDYPVKLMQQIDRSESKPEIWEEFREIIAEANAVFNDFEYLERNEFYARSRKAYAIVTTSEIAGYANIILTKGVI